MLCDWRVLMVLLIGAGSQEVRLPAMIKISLVPYLGIVLEISRVASYSGYLKEEIARVSAFFKDKSPELETHSDNRERCCWGFPC